MNVPAGLADLEAPQDFARGLRDAMDSVGGYELYPKGSKYHYGIYL